MSNEESVKPKSINVLPVGTILYGYCGGHFGDFSFSDKQIEAIGLDWIVARTIISRCMVLATSHPINNKNIHETLSKYTIPEQE